MIIIVFLVFSISLCLFGITLFIHITGAAEVEFTYRAAY